MVRAVKEVVSGLYPKRLFYNAQGQLAQEMVTIPGAPQSYTTAFYYDSYLRPYATQYPDGEVVKVNYNSMGLPSLMCSAYWNSGQNAYWCDSNPWYVSDANYDEAGRLRYRKLPAGGNLWQSYYYFPWTASPWGGADGNSNGRLWYIGLGTNPDGYDRMLLDYRYDSFGNVSQHNPNEGVWNSFSYDAQNRLTAGYGRSYGYDAAGRMSSYEGTTQSYHPYRPHAMAPNWSQYAVDLNGNFTSRVQNGVVQTLTWDHENRLASVTGSGINESYLYDADGQRVKKVSNGTTSYYPNQYYEQYGGSNVDKYYYFNGQPIALRRNGTLYYLHQDQIGNLVLVTSGGNRVDAQGFYAYGKLRSGFIGVERSFTGQQKDLGTGLIYFKSRYYDPELGTFLSPDTVVPDAGNLFDYNRYMYVRGRPLNLSDPTGHFGAEFTGGGSCAQIGMCYTMLSSYAAAKQEAEVTLAVQATASVLFGDVNDVVTVATGYDVIRGESVPYLSQEWAETLGWAVLPLFSHSGIKAADELVEIAGKNLDEAVGKHGPFSRIENAEAASQIEASGSLWGEPMRNNFVSDIPRVKAYDRRLRDGELGIEFYTDVAPDTGSPPGRAYWSGPRDGVAVENGKAIICCTVTKNTHR